jgi:pyridoxal/pyridoxine/pyridoxamine kinase
MTIKYLATALAVTVGLLFSVSTAHAGRPLDVDCDVLESAIICADAILDANNVAFNGVGDLFSSAILDDAVFEQLSSLILFCSDGAIDFDSASQAISTVSSCGLLPLLNDEIGD